MRTIAVVNQKGGCGKTTVSINLASALANTGKSTLLVDMDPQSHCAVGLAVPEEQIEQSIYDVLIGSSRGEPVGLNNIVWDITDNFKLAPSSIDLSAFSQQMSGVAERDKALTDVLERVKDDYDYVIIDCPPAVGLLTFNALRAATDVIVPVETGYFALHGLSKQLQTLNILCRRCNKKLNVKVLASMYDVRTKMARQILAELRSHFGDKMLKTTINFNTKLKEAASLGQPISEYDPASRGRTDFRNLAMEILQRDGEKSTEDPVKSLSDRLEEMSTTANELMEQSKSLPARQPIEEYKSQTKKQKFETKLCDYYGVSQKNGSVVFVTLYPSAGNVQIAADFNNWQPDKTPLKKVGESGIWQTELKIPPGKHRYRLVVDGKWQQDPYNGKTEPNPFGDLNSIVEVK